MTATLTIEEQLKQAKQFIADHEKSAADQDKATQDIISRTIAVDFDDTLFVGLWQPTNPTHEIGEPIWPNINKAKQLVLDGYYIVIYTARGWEDEERIANACKDVGLDILRVSCAKPIAVGYVDDRACHESQESWGPRKRITQP